MRARFFVYLSKMKTFRLCLLASLCIAGIMSCAPRYDVYLLIGQSNMAGRGVFEPADTAEALAGVYLLDDEGRPVPAREPLNRYSTIRKALHVQGMGPAHSFAKEVRAGTGRRILLVVNARGGSSLEQWMPDAPTSHFTASENDNENHRGEEMPSFYAEAVRRTRQALHYGQLKAILWHQGESNSDPGQVETYLPMLSEFVSSLRRDLGVGEAVPFIAGQIQPGHRNAPYFNPIISRIGEYVPNSCCVESTSLDVLPDGLHFTRDAQLELGRRYANALLPLK